MIFLDRREPEELASAIRRLGVEVVWGAHVTFEAGDIVFEGNGERGPGAMVGVERKKLGDVIESMKNRRLSGRQLREMHKLYDYSYLLTEGLWRPGSSGEIEHWAWAKKRVPGTGPGTGKLTKWFRKQEWTAYYGRQDEKSVNYRHLAGYLHSLALRSRSPQGEPLRWIRTASLDETAAQIVSLYNGFTKKSWHEHHAHDQLYDGLPPKRHGGEWAEEHGHDVDGRGRWELENPNTAWRWAAQLPGIARKGQELAKYFGTGEEMVLAGLDAELKKRVLRWFALHPERRVRAWQDALGVEKGTAKAKAAIHAMTTRGA